MPTSTPTLDIAQATKDVLADAEKAAAPLREELSAVQARQEAELAGELAKHGKGLADIKAAASEEAARSPAERGAQALAQLVKQKEWMRQGGALPPDAEATGSRRLRPW